MSNAPQVTLVSHSGTMMSHGGTKTVTSYEIFLNNVRLRGYSTHGNMEEGYWGVAAHRLAREYAEAVAATLGVRVIRARVRPKEHSQTHR